MLQRLLTMMLIASVAEAGDLRGLPNGAQEALAPAITAAVARFNDDEDQRRQTPQIQASGPAGEPSLLRATYRKAESAHDVVAVESDAAPTVTVRVRAVEFEKRVTNVNGGDLHAQLLEAPWLKTPRGYVIDFRFGWNGTVWEPRGEPVIYPTLGVVGRPELERALESGRLLERGK